VEEAATNDRTSAAPLRSGITGTRPVMTWEGVIPDGAERRSGIAVRM